MERRDPKRLTGYSEVEDALRVRSENGAILPADRDLHFDFDEGTAREHAIARLRLLWENRRLLMRVSAGALLLSAAIALLIPNRYQSVARLMPPDSQASPGMAMAAMALGGGSGDSGGGGALGGLGGIATQLLGMKSTSDLLVGVLSSRTVADTVIHKYDLQKVYGTSRMEDTRTVLANRTEALVDRKSQIITITVTDHDPHRALGMAQTYVEELNRVLALVSTSSARRERIFLEGRLQTVSRDLENAEKEFSQFASQNTAIDIKEQGKAMLASAAMIQGQLIAARSELEGLRQIYTDNNVRVRSVQARVAELQSQLLKIGGQGGAAPAEEVNSNNEPYPTIRKLPLLGVTYADLYRKTKVQEAAFETLTQEYEIAKVQEAKEIPSVKVLDPPNLPDKKSFPPRTLIVLLGSSVALIAGMVFVVGKNRWDEMDPADPGKLLAHEVVHTIQAALPWAARNGSSLGARSEVRNRNSGMSGRKSEP